MTLRNAKLSSVQVEKTPFFNRRLERRRVFFLLRAVKSFGRWNQIKWSKPFLSFETRSLGYLVILFQPFILVRVNTFHKSDNTTIDKQNNQIFLWFYGLLTIVGWIWVIYHSHKWNSERLFLNFGTALSNRNFLKFWTILFQNQSIRFFQIFLTLVAPGLYIRDLNNEKKHAHKINRHSYRKFHIGIPYNLSVIYGRAFPLRYKNQPHFSREIFNNLQCSHLAFCSVVISYYSRL